MTHLNLLVIALLNIDVRECVSGCVCVCARVSGIIRNEDRQEKTTQWIKDNAISRKWGKARTKNPDFAASQVGPLPPLMAI